MLLGADHRPMPPSDIERRVKQIDPHLGLRWEENGVGGPGWWVIYEWPANDKRRAMIARGDMDPDSAFDLYAQLPKDCPVEQAYGYLVTALRSSGLPEAKRLLDRVSEYNKAQTERAWQPVIEDAMEHAETNAGKLFPHLGTVVKSYRKVAPRKRGK